MTAIARNTYLSNEDFRDPVDCTLFYFALRKKNLVQSLWRTASYHREQAATLRFLANDFSQPRWQTAASKNAFALLGKQRFRKLQKLKPFDTSSTMFSLMYRIRCCFLFVSG